MIQIQIDDTDTDTDEETWKYVHVRNVFRFNFTSFESNLCASQCLVLVLIVYYNRLRCYIVFWKPGQRQGPRLVVYYMDHPPCWALIWHNDDDDDDDNDDHDDHDDQYDDDDHDDDEPSNQTKIKSLKVIHVSSHQKKLLFRFSTNIEAAILHVY